MNNQVVLAQLREIRKLRRGLMLFEIEDHGTALLDRMRRIEAPIELLEGQYGIMARGTVPFAEPVVPDETAPDWNFRQRLNLYFLAESAALYLLQLDVDFMYSKPKWLAFDVAQADSLAVTRLVNEIEREYVAAVDIPDVAAQAQLAASRLRGEPGISAEAHESAAATLSDAFQLAKMGERAAASWPLRMSILMIARNVLAAEHLPYQDYRSLGPVMPIVSRRHPDLARVLRSSVLADIPVNASYADLWDQARTELSKRRDAAFEIRRRREVAAKR